MIIGLTGKSCSGKNEVGRMLSEYGLDVWDTDSMCHEGLEENIDAVAAAFGNSVVSESGGKRTVSRSTLGKIVFSDTAKLRVLEGILYPWLKKRIIRWRNENPDEVLVLNGALLYRSGFNRLCNSIIYVDAPYEVRLRRALERDGISEEDFLRRENSQTDVDYRTVDYGVPLYVVVNDGVNFRKVRRQVFIICDKLDILKARL